MNREVVNPIKSFVILVMAFLLLTAPCSMRNNLESSLEIATTKPLNPIKTANNFSNYCSIIENTSEKRETQEVKNNILKKIQSVASISVDYSYDSEIKDYIPSSKESSWIPPYYILYKRLKIFDLSKINFA